LIAFRYLLLRSNAKSDARVQREQENLKPHRAMPSYRIKRQTADFIV
jgi:hypothetical protein